MTEECINRKLNYVLVSNARQVEGETFRKIYPYPYYLTMMMRYYRISASIAQVIPLFLLVPQSTLSAS